MSVTKNLSLILAELTANQRHIEEEGLQALVNQILQANHVFLAGSGRSGVAIRGFANRLMHLGKSVSLVGDISSPHSTPGDLLIIGSGSGETESLVALAHKAKRSDVRIGLITMDAASTIGQLADAVVVLPGVSPKLQGAAQVTSIQPMGSAFEQISFLTYDAIILELMQRTGQTTDTMFPRHADLE
ncbi:6-phospho-3-hexuloisomerase [Tessaracoccus caeni]|uniref:6-phospho-3-hexuloisomerase n=1 Tax=Tessaracoccus caeni TaxID=3031239 RepID=UPI0023DCC706|nr:6-phospho-3-hexuloisomerase [Tessaracoccus caeni]MDF1489031.1 SIS domain-containing protein [Tessaracoccus caeni]